MEKVAADAVEISQERDRYKLDLERLGGGDSLI